jgi:ribosomal protein S18 acetylase RimI-like enzyme
MNFRRATKEDTDKLYPLVLASQLFQKKELEGKQLDEGLFEQEDRKTFDEWIVADDKAYFIAGDEKKDIIGFVLCMIDNTLSKDGSISDLYVVPESREHGVGKSLVEKAIAWLKEKGVKHVALAVQKQNTSAVKVYEAAGFSQKEDSYLLMGMDL